MARSSSSNSKQLEEILIGPFGGPGGKNWIYKPDGLIKEIIIVYGALIDSIQFKTTLSNQDGKTEYSPTFGGSGGNTNKKVQLNSPLEYLTNITATIGRWPDQKAPLCITSLVFFTNITQYGPFGTPTTNTISIPMEGGVVVGFHGRVGVYLDAIGIYVKPIRSIYVPKVLKESQESMMDYPSANFKFRAAGPWGGFSGKEWDDGVNYAIKQVLVLSDDSKNVVHAVRFEYEKTDGVSVWSTMHGGPGGVATNRINIDYPREFLIGIAGYYGPEKVNGGLDTIRSLTFYTNMAQYGPYGTEVGTYFLSSACKGKVLGFHGRSGAFLNTIGVHMEYN